VIRRYIIHIGLRGEDVSSAVAYDVTAVQAITKYKRENPGILPAIFSLFCFQEARIKTKGA
jgi:hypothetical protein